MLGEGQSSEDVFVMSVQEHNTGVKGAARLMITSKNMLKLEGYVNHIRPLLDPRNKLNTLLVLDGPRQLTNIHGYIKALR